MLKELSSVQAYLPFIRAMLADPDFCDPMLATQEQLRQHLLDAHEDPAKHLFGTFDGEALTGLFSVLVLPEGGICSCWPGFPGRLPRMTRCFRTCRRRIRGIRPTSSIPRRAVCCTRRWRPGMPPLTLNN